MTPSPHTPEAVFALILLRHMQACEEAYRRKK